MPGSKVTRRDVLALPGALGIGALAGCVPPPLPPAPPLPGPTAARTIDVHCHLFNARDIPVEPFVREVVLREYPLFDAAAKELVLLAQAIMDLGAIPALDEARELRGQVSAAAGAASPGLPDIKDDDALIRDRVQRAVGNLLSARQSPSLALELQGPARQMTPQLERFLRNLIRRTGTNGAAASASMGQQAPGVTPDAAAAAVTGIGGEIRGIVLLASLLTLPRASLAERLRRLPASDGGEVVLFTPAMVDFGYWLGAEHATTPLAEQVEVMSALAARKGTPYAVHAYVSYCPWRQLLEPQQLDIVKDAILNRGCIGVKLYPVMGFLPYGNANALDKAAYPRRLRALGADWAERLDKALADLYTFCVEEQVPVLTHCSLSQDPSDVAGRRASPAAWAAVLRNDRWPSLRLNLGHFGGFWSLTKPGLDGWTAAAVDLIRACPNVFADVSDHAAVVQADAKQREDETQVLGNLNRILAAHDPDRVARGKLMYGTDWLMLSRDPGIEAYYPRMKSRFIPGLQLTEAETRLFLGLNAARFLGLVPAAGETEMPRTRKRLEAFYKTNGLDSSVLANWDGRSA